MRKLTALVVALALVSTASAATFTATINAAGTATEGVELDITITGVLDTDTDNDGLVFVSVDISAAGPAAVNMGTAVSWGPPGDGSMDLFVQPLGYDANYGGTGVGDDDPVCRLLFLTYPHETELDGHFCSSVFRWRNSGRVHGRAAKGSRTDPSIQSG